MDRIDYINKLIQKKYTSTRKQNIIVNNFYSLLTIAIMSVAIMLYVNFVLPAYNSKKDKEINKNIEKQKHKEYILQRKRQIELSHKLNEKQ